MSRTPLVLRRTGTAALAAVALVAGSPALLGPAAAQTAPAPTGITLSADDSAAAGTCAAFVVTVTGSGGAKVSGAVVDVVLTERTASAGQDLDPCTAPTGTRVPQEPAKATDSGAAGSTDRFEVTTGADGTAVVGVVASEKGTADIAAFVDTNGDDVRQATELQDVAALYVTPGGPAGSPAAANAVQCVDAQPETDTNVAGEQQVVTAVLTNDVTTDLSTGAQTARGLVADSGTNPCGGDTVAGVTASATVTGANAGATVTCTVSSNAGRSRCTYPAARTGTDTVKVFVNQTEGAGGPGPDANEPADTVTRTASAAPSGLQVDLTCAKADVGTGPEDCAAAVPAGKADATVGLVATVVRRAANGAATPVPGVLVRFTEAGKDATVATSTAPGTAGNGGVTTTDAQECVTANNGTCTAVLTERTPVGGETYAVTATVRGQDPAGDVAEGTSTGEISSDSGTVVFRNAPKDARFLDLRPEGEVTTQSGTFRELTAVVTDVNGSPVAGVGVAFTEVGAGAFRDGSSRYVTTTDATGTARADVTSGASETGTQQVTATITTAGTQCSAAAGSGATDTTPTPAAGVCSDTEDNRFSTGPAPCSTVGSTSVTPAVIGSGQRSRVTVASTPGRTVRLYAYSQPSTTFVAVRSATATASTTTFDVTPPTNTRLYGQEEGCTQSPSVVVTVRSAVGISATRNASRVYTFSGGTLPRRPGQVVSLFRKGSTGDVLTAQVKTDSSGRYSITRRFTGSGLFDFYTRTSTDLVNASGSSLVRRTLVY
ncbi:MAG: hypothetical protein JWN17_1063 [Frankiales bacterium]|nr:hypothetical protein [Frankiales bacterium]